MAALDRPSSRGGWHFHWVGQPAGDREAAYAALALRLVLASFFTAHLCNKFFTRQGFWGWWAALRHNHPAYVPIYVLTVEFSGAILFLIGLRTRWVALWAIPSFIGIILFWLQIGGYWFTNPGAEFPVMWLCMLLLKLILGDGAYSLRFDRAGRGLA